MGNTATKPPPPKPPLVNLVKTACFPDEQLGVGFAQCSNVREADELRTRFPPMVAYRAGRPQNAVLLTDANRLGVFR